MSRSPSSDPLSALGRFGAPASLILTSLVTGPKHGYGLTKDIEGFAGVRLGPGTLYEALARLEERGLVASLPAEERRRPYAITELGSKALADSLERTSRVADVARSRLGAVSG